MRMQCKRSNMMVIFILSGKCRWNSFLCIFPAADKGGQSGSLLITSYSAPLTMIDSGLITQESHRGLWLCFLATREPFRKAFGCYVFLSKAKNHRLKGHWRDWLFKMITKGWSLIKEANEHLALEWLEFQRLTQIGLCEKVTKEERLLALYGKQQPPPTPLKILPLLLVLNAECTLELQNSFSAFLWSFFSFGGRWDAGISVWVVFVTQSVMVLLQKIQWSN